jgi:hypothetical protein
LTQHIPEKELVVVEHCVNNHPTPTSAHRDGSGTCLECKREANRVLRLKNRAALDVVKVFEAAGVQFQNNGVPVPAEQVAQQLVQRYGQTR